MHSIQFWKSWPKIYQRIFWATIGLLFVSLLYLWIAYFQAPGPALAWEFIQEQELLEVPVHSFQSGPFKLTVKGDNYLIFERLLGTDLTPQPVAAYFFLSLLVLSAVLILSVITTLSRFWYSIGMGLFILFVVGFRLELLQVFGFTNKLPTLVVLILYVSVSYYFHAFKSTTSFIARLTTFAVLTVFVGAVLILFAQVSLPAFHLAASGYIAGILISAIFIVTVSHEILASFIRLVTSGTRPTKSLNHFLIISTIYMVNLFLAYANKIHLIDWDFLAVNFFLLLTISGILGIWGFRQRQPQYEGIIDADPFGVYFFVGLAVICFGMIAWLLASANDPAADALRDVIIYSHLGYGILFLLYVLSNFMGMLGENLQVHKVLYQPNNMPFFTFRFAGLIAMLAFFFYNSWQVPVRNAQAGYYNAMGDIYNTHGANLAEAYYTKSGLFGFQNHHANYAIANLESRRLNTDKERTYYKRASANRPTEMSYLNWANTYQREGQWLEALLALRDSEVDFPTSGVIKNTKGLIYAKINLIDSALMTLDGARQQSFSKNSAEINFVGLIAKHNLTVDADSLFQLIGSSHAGVEANALGLANLQNKKIPMNLPLPKDSSLNLFSATLLNNYLVNHLGEGDSSAVNQTMKLARVKQNEDYKEQLLVASAIALYANGEIGKAFNLLEEVVFSSDNQGKYNHILAQWALEQDAADVALNYLSYSVGQNFPDAALTNAIALSEADMLGEAIVAWDSLKSQGDTTQLQMAERMLKALALPESLVSKMDDTAKYLYCRYRIDAHDSIAFNRILNSVSHPDLKAKAIIDRTKKLIRLDELKAATKVFQKINGLEMGDKITFEDFQHTELNLMAEGRDLESLALRLKEVTFTSNQRNELLYYNTLINENSGDVTAATANFERLARTNPFFDEAVVASARFFKTHSKDDMKAYKILVDALQENPKSVKILKAYFLEATQLGFSDFAQSAQEGLLKLIGQRAFNQFVAENRKILSPENNP